jgi:hypothetical protein
MWRHIVWQNFSDISEKRTVIFRDKDILSKQHLNQTTWRHIPEGYSVSHEKLRYEPYFDYCNDMYCLYPTITSYVLGVQKQVLISYVA